MKPFVALGPPAEAILARQAGYRQIGAVVGVSVVQTTMNQALSGLDGTELKSRGEAVSVAVDNARSRAIEQAKALGASIVTGVRFELLEREETMSNPALIEVRCVGTAGGGSEDASVPLLTNLDGGGLLALVATGYRPVGLAVGFAYYSQIPGYRTTNAQGSRNAWGFNPYEHPDYTRAVYQTRHLAIERLEADARALAGEGVIGVDLSPKIRIREGLRAGLFLIGTAVRRDRWSHVSGPEPAIVVSVGDSKMP